MGVRKCPANPPVWGSGFCDSSGRGSCSLCKHLLRAEYVPDAVWPWDTKKKKKGLCRLRRPLSPGVQAGSSRSRESRATHLPLPGDEIDVVSQRWVVSGQVLRRSVLSRVVRLGGVRLGQRAQAHEQGQGEGQSGQPQSLATQHLRTPKVQQRGLRGFRGPTLSIFLLWPQRPSRSYDPPSPTFNLRST